MAIVRVRSHRARNKLIALLGMVPQGYTIFLKGGEWRDCPDDLLAQATQIKGITKSKKTADMMRTVSWS